MTELREFLRHHFIGAIIIGLLGYQGLAALISAIISPIAVLTTNIQMRAGVLEQKEPLLNWYRLVPSIVQGLLMLTAAYLMLRWLYGMRGNGLPADSGESVE